jgi:hypothetical protein
MAKLSAKGRRRVRTSNFVYPRTRSYPIHDQAHGRAALRMAARKDTKGSYATVKKAVCRKYPSLGACQRTARKGGGKR